MKLLVVLAVLICFSVNCFTQTNEFAPIGAKWWYDYSYFSLDGYKTLESVGDTIIDGKTCRIIASTIFAKDLANPDPVLDTIYLNNTYIYSDSGVVYNYTLGSFYTLYDFNSTVGDSWEVGGVSLDGICDSTGQIQVESNSIITINTFDLNQIYTSSIATDYWNFGTVPIIERIGSLNFLFATPQECLFDFYEGGPLRCYYDNEFGYYNVDTSVSCDFVLSMNQESLNPYIHIWPNPFTERINISIPLLQSNLLLNIYNLNGLLIHQQQCEPFTSIPCSDFSKGLYIIEFSSSFFHKTYKLTKL